MKPARIFRLVSCLLLLIIAAAPAAAMDEAAAQQLLKEANELFRNGNERMRTDPVAAKDAYRGAVIRFERLVSEGGIHNGKLFYNIGNAYFRMDDLGRAILNYRRAEQFLSHDENLTQNLRYARSRRVDQITEKQETQVLRTLLFWHYDLSARTRSMIFLVFFAGFWTLASLRLFFADRIPKAALALCGGFALVFLGSLLTDTFTEPREGGVIVAEQVVARKGDGDTYEPSFKEPLHAGAEFTLVENRGDWYQVELADGQRCWIPAVAAGLIAGPVSPRLVVFNETRREVSRPLGFFESRCRCLMREALGIEGVAESAHGMNPTRTRGIFAELLAQA